MVYKRRYYKNTKKKNNFYRRTKFSKFNLYTHRSSKNQANQIYALNNKVNKIEKLTKPEVRSRTCELCNHLFTTDGNLGSYGVKEWHTMIYLYSERLFSEHYAGYQLQGGTMRPQNITIFGSFENKNHNAVVDGKLYNCPQTGYLRLILCRLIGGNQGRYPDMITRPYNWDEETANPEPDIGLITGPLVKNASSGLKIVKNKIIKINVRDPVKMFKFTIKNPGTYRVGPYRNSEPAFKNEYLLYIQYYCPVQFFADGYTGQQPVAPIQRINSGIKFAFVDES